MNSLWIALIVHIIMESYQTRKTKLSYLSWKVRGQEENKQLMVDIVVNAKIGYKLDCVAHPYCAQFLASLARGSQRAHIFNMAASLRSRVGSPGK